MWFTLLVRPLSDVLKALRDKGPDPIARFCLGNPAWREENSEFEKPRERTMFLPAIAYGGTTLSRER